MPTHANIYIAVIDDEVSICRALGRLLRASGYHAITYTSAEEFLNDQNRPTFECLIVDVQLANLSGVDLQQHLASHGESLPIIFMTANDDAALRERAQSLGCVAYLHKTSAGTELLQTIRALLSKEGNHR